MVDYMKCDYTITIESGVFGANMQVHLVNDGPVTVTISKELIESGVI